MTEAGLRSGYKNTPELLEEMLEVKTMEELCTLFDDESFVEKGKGKQKRFYEAITGKSLNNSSEDNGDKKTYVAIYPILCNGEMIEANSVVTDEELGSDLERLINIGAVGELLDKD